MNRVYHAEEYKCKKVGNCNSYLIISRINRGKLTILTRVKNKLPDSTEMDMKDVPEMLKKISEVYNKDLKEQEKPGKLEVIIK